MLLKFYFATSAPSLNVCWRSVFRTGKCEVCESLTQTGCTWPPTHVPSSSLFDRGSWTHSVSWLQASRHSASQSAVTTMSIATSMSMGRVRSLVCICACGMKGLTPACSVCSRLLCYDAQAATSQLRHAFTRNLGSQATFREEVVDNEHGQMDLIDQDPEVFGIIKKEKSRQTRGLELIASEVCV